MSFQQDKATNPSHRESTGTDYNSEGSMMSAERGGRGDNSGMKSGNPVGMMNKSGSEVLKRMKKPQPKDRKTT